MSSTALPARLQDGLTVMHFVPHRFQTRLLQTLTKRVVYVLEAEVGAGLPALLLSLYDSKIFGEGNCFPRLSYFLALFANSPQILGRPSLPLCTNSHHFAVTVSPHGS